MGSFKFSSLVPFHLATPILTASSSDRMTARAVTTAPISVTRRPMPDTMSATQVEPIEERVSAKNTP